MSERHVLRDLPAHLALVRELARIEFEFDSPADRPYRIRGYAPGSVVEVIAGPPLGVTLLFSADDDRPSLVRSTLSLVTLASVLGVDFTDWLAGELRRRGRAACWRAARHFAAGVVRVEHVGRAAMVLHIEAGGSGEGQR